MSVGLRSSALAAVALFALAAPGLAAEPATPNPMSAFAGTWRVNLARSTTGRAGPGATEPQRDASFTWVYKTDGKTLKWFIYHEFPAPKPSKTMTVIPDGKFRPCEMTESCLSRPGDPKDQSYAFVQLGDRAMMREFRIKGVPSEYNVYAVSPDGQTFVTTIWSPDTPQYQTKMVFEKQP